MRILPLALLVLVTSAAAQDVPVGEVKWDELRDNLSAVDFLWSETNELPPRSLLAAWDLKDSAAMQRAVDAAVAFVVTINPEARVKVQRGPAAVRLNLGWPIPVLVKVINEGGVTGSLNVTEAGEPTITARMFEHVSPSKTSTLTRKLSGRGVEYQLLLFRSTAVGRCEVELTFDVGKETQDLGMRAKVPVLVETVEENRLFYPNKADLLSTHLKDVEGIVHHWQMRKKGIQQNFEAVSGGPRGVREKWKGRDLRVKSEEILERVVRRSVTFLTVVGDRVPAIVLLPRQREGKLPAILCLHQTTKLGKAEPAGLGGKQNLHYALELAERGYITISPDYPGYGDYSSCDPYQLNYNSATAKGIDNHQAALDVLAAMPEVDSERIGCIGHSLGGHNTLFVSLFDERIKVLATSCGFCSFPRYMRGNLKGWSHKGYMPRIDYVYQNDPKQMPFDFTEILAAMAPRPVFINAPLKDDNFDVEGVKDCVKAALPVYKLLGKPEHLVVEHPDTGHDFPPEVRQKCYQFFDRYLRDRAASK